jgi:superfamily I DNA and RNA helicase
VQSLISRGVAVENIAVLTGRGHANSSILKKNQLGDFTVRRFTGQYSVDGEPIHTDGNLLLESIYRFKGQSADGIVLTEFDFETLDDPVRRKLFVGMTRAHLAVELVLSAQAESALERVLSS